MTPPRAVVCGTGFGGRVHVPALRAAGFEVCALVGTDPGRTARRAARLGVEGACTSLAEALARPGVVAVTVATPPATHAALVLEAVGAGRQVLCEKPLALDAAQARGLRDAARGAGVTGLVGHEFRFTAAGAAIATALAAGAAGTPRLATLVVQVPLLLDPSLRMPDWWRRADRGGGWLMASGSHTVDTLRSWLGEVESVAGELLPLPGTTVDAGYTARLRFRSGAAALVVESAAAHGPPLSLTRVAGSEAGLGVEACRAWIADAAGQRPLAVPAWAAEVAPAASPAAPRDRFTGLELGPWTKLATELRGAVEGQPPGRAATFADGVAVMEVLDAIRRSAERGGEPVSVAAGGGAQRSGR